MAIDYSAFLEMTPEEIYQDWLNFVQSRDPLLQDTSIATFNSILAEAIASEMWIFIKLLKQKVEDASILTATGNALSAIVQAYSITRQAGTKATGAIKFLRTTAATYDITIPIGTLCAALSDSETLIQFQTTEEGTLAAGETSATVAAEALVAGIAGNVSTGTVKILLRPIVGINTCINDAAFADGTDQESDADLRARALYTFWLPGKATVPLIEEHVSGVEGVREVKVTTIGQGDVLIIVDSVGGKADPEPEIGDMIEENRAAGNTFPGLLCGSIRAEGNTFQIGDCAGGKVWVRTLQYIGVETVVPFTYLTDGGIGQNGSITFPAGTAAGETLEATLHTTTVLASQIVSSTYEGSLEFDFFIGLGSYPNIWVPPELQAVDVAGTIVLTATPEVGLLDSIKASIEAKLASYRIADVLQHSDVYRYLFMDYATGRVFSGIDDVTAFTLTCKGNTISFGQSLTLDNDERVEVGDLDGLVAT